MMLYRYKKTFEIDNYCDGILQVLKVSDPYDYSLSRAVGSGMMTRSKIRTEHHELPGLSLRLKAYSYPTFQSNLTLTKIILRYVKYTNQFLSMYTVEYVFRDMHFVEISHSGEKIQYWNHL